MRKSRFAVYAKFHAHFQPTSPADPLEKEMAAESRESSRWFDERYRKSKLRLEKKWLHGGHNTREVDYISARVTNSIQPGSKAAFNEPIASAWLLKEGGIHVEKKQRGTGSRVIHISSRGLGLDKKHSMQFPPWAHPVFYRYSAE